MTPAEEVQVARGVRGRQLRRLVPMADRRAHRRFVAWLDVKDPTDWSARNHLSDLYQQAERLLDDLLRTRIAR